MKFKFWGYAIPTVFSTLMHETRFFTKFYEAHSTNTVCVNVQFKNVHEEREL